MYKRGDLNHISRALRVLDELRGFRRGRRLSDLASQLQSSERTIRRDLADLRSAGFEIESVSLEGRAGARLVEKTYSNIAITRRERYTLLAIASLFDVLRGTPLWEDVTSLQRKLEQRMSPEERAEHVSLGDRFAYVPDGGTKAYEGKEDILDALMTGVLSRRVVRFAYRDARGRTRTGYVAPYTMLLYKHGLYVVGCRLREPADGKAIAPGAAIAVYAVERFTDAEPLRNAPFVAPAGFRITEILNGAFGIHVMTDAPPHRVVIEFSAAKAAFVRARVWHPTQTFEELPDQRVRLTFTCASLIPVVSWVLEWGPHARALAPPELVADIIAELDAARAAYAAPPSPPLAEPAAPCAAPPLAEPAAPPSPPLAEPAAPRAAPPLAEPAAPRAAPPLAEPAAPRAAPPLAEPASPRAAPPLAEPDAPPLAKPDAPRAASPAVPDDAATHERRAGAADEPM